MMNYTCDDIKSSKKYNDFFCRGGGDLEVCDIVIKSHTSMSERSETNKLIPFNCFGPTP